MIVIVGGGLAGLSCAWHLGDAAHVVLEREKEAGGLTRSVSDRGFLFDYTGHLLHLRDDYAKQLCDDLLGEDQEHLERSAWIQFKDRIVPYPFQVNTCGLPDEVRIECVKAFAESLLPENRAEPGALVPPASPLPLSFLNINTPTGGYAATFADWTKKTFGEGFARHFFLPYNTKNFAADLQTITAEWVSWAVPKPGLEDVLRGALGGSEKEFGYNPRFRYPKSGGIRRLPDALARRLKTLRTGADVMHIDAAKRRCTLAGGEALDYDHLVTSAPLPELIARTSGLGDDVRDAVKALRWCAVSSFNFGLRGALGHDRHWMYFPEEAYRFYRVGFPSNLTAAMAPTGQSSICAEVAYPSNAFPPGQDEERQVEEELVQAGVLDDPDRIVLRQRLDLPYAYVLFDEARRTALPVIFKALFEKGIIPVGRYGAWDYLSMEQAMLQGKETAEYLQSDAAVRPGAQ